MGLPAGHSRRRATDPLRDSPALDTSRETRSLTAQPSRVDQVRELLDLVDRGLLSDEEFARQQAKVLGS